MKKNKFLAILGAILVLSLTSCTKWIDPNINKDPDSPTDVPVNLLLPSVEVNLGYVMGDFDVAGVTAMWMQYIQGTDRQAVAIYNYQLTQTDVNNLWNDIYTGPLMDLKDIKTKAQKEGAYGYVAVADILTAYTLGSMTALFGDIPYSDALNGYPPKYDSQESIYNSIFNLLNEAIDLINKYPDQSVANDFYYHGDMSKWKAAAYSLLARYTIRIANRKTPDWNKVIEDVNNGIQSNADNMKQYFTTKSSENNPLYQFSVQRSGYASNNPYFQNMLQSDNDPRDSVLTWDNKVGYWLKPNSPVCLMSYTEGLFIKAEAYAQLGNLAEAKQTLADAVKASLERYGVYDDNWYNNYLTNVVAKLTTKDDILHEIWKQKYIDNMFNPEAWADYRRTGWPQLIPVTGDQVPERFPYPTDEVSYNPNTPKYGTIFNPLWFSRNYQGK